MKKSYDRVKNVMQELPVQFIPLLILASLWSFFWKGFALYRAANAKQKLWFVGLFVTVPLNDLGIVALIYLFKFAKRPLTIKEIKSWRNIIQR